MVHGWIWKHYRIVEVDDSSILSTKSNRRRWGLTIRSTPSKHLYRYSHCCSIHVASTPQSRHAHTTHRSIASLVVHVSTYFGHPLFYLVTLDVLNPGILCNATPPNNYSISLTHSSRRLFPSNRSTLDPYRNTFRGRGGNHALRSQYVNTCQKMPI